MTDFRCIVTGSRKWTNRALLEKELDRIVRYARRHAPAARVVFVHGDCPKGADAMCEAWVRRHLPSDVGCTERWPAAWNEGPSAGPRRNQAMVDAGAELCIAFPTADSVGTWDCIRRANRAGAYVRIVPEPVD